MPDKPTPDTLAYLILALTTAGIVIGAYLVSIAARYRNLQQDIKLIEQLSNDQ